MQDRSSKRPTDPNQLAKLVTDIAVGDHPAVLPPDSSKNEAAVLLGRRGGIKGGKARAENMTSQERSEAAKRAAIARWNRDK